MNRRKLLVGLIALGNLTLAAVLGIPAALAALSPALRARRDATWRPVGPLEGFPVGEVVKAAVELDDRQWSAAFGEKAVYVWRRSDSETVVFSRNCTDLSCPVNYDPGSTCFFCPCHGGIFAQDGTPMAGPPSEPLYRYANRVEQGILEIDIHSVPPMN
jgi:menaquinol-cytochrome c reductase iron-sulfur subunit